MSVQKDQSSALLAELARPTSAYKQRAWLALAGLAGFMLLYFVLAFWFLFTAYRLVVKSSIAHNGAFIGYIVGICAAFLALFMLKAVFFVKRGGTDDSVEVTAAQQPRLFEFLEQLADQAGAPRPHRVFLSARVNAAVFYDLSVINLLLPSKKNLEIGLGLVNSLTLGELRAVLAHEFGHFAQRAMAVGRWVYVAQQIAGHLVARRDKLDDFLKGLSRFDIRIAWVGWILSLIVWSIRSLVDTAFNVVVIMQRALSREMEMQADLVAVSLTGSDALIHALHRLQSADDSWGTALSFAAKLRGDNRLLNDVFALQTQVEKHMAQLMSDPHYASVPPLPIDQPERYRLFKAELAQPPQMWLTHPMNHEREANAKRHYVAAPIDQSSAWDIFDDVNSLREQVSAKLFEAGDATPMSVEDALRELAKEFEREHLKPAYRGIYYGRSPVRSAKKPSDLYMSGAVPDDLDRLYPESLTHDMAQLEQCEKELGQLRAMQSGFLTASAKAIQLRGKTYELKELPRAIATIEQESNQVRQKLDAHDRLCRSVNLAIAEKMGNGWGEYLCGILALLHYADHAIADLRDAQGLLSNTVNVVTATRRVNDAGINRILEAANALYQLLDDVYKQSDLLVIDKIVLQRLNVADWKELLGELKLVWATRSNISDWLNVIDSWVNQAVGAFNALRLQALEQLLISEAVVAKNFRQGTQIIPAPLPSQVPGSYNILLPGQERQRQNKLDWWARFQIADGLIPTFARLGVAGGIVAVVLGFGGAVGSADVIIYNGLARPVVVNIDNKTVYLAALSSTTETLDTDHNYRIQAVTGQRELIESFNVDVKESFTHFVYNIASASPLVEWTSVYGSAQPKPERMLGTPRWTTTEADDVFVEPPKSISTKSGGGTREVLSGFGIESAARQLSLLKAPADQKNLILAHARWDETTSPNIGQWLGMASQLPEFASLLEARLKESPNDVWLMRIAVDVAKDAGKQDVCARYQARAQAAPQDPDLQYVAARCLPTETEKMVAFRLGRERWPAHGWFAYAHGYGEAEAAHWRVALASLAQARSVLPSLADWIATDQIRIQRLLQQGDAQQWHELAKGTSEAATLLVIESDAKLDVAWMKSYQALAHGQLAEAINLAHDNPDAEARMVRMVAASDGATAPQIDRAQALPITQGLDDGTAWVGVALAMRAQRDAAPYLAAIKNTRPEHTEIIQQFLKHLPTSNDLQAAQQMLNGLPPEQRGYAYSSAVILLGNRAPRDWRDAAKRLLFASERPYFL